MASEVALVPRVRSSLSSGAFATGSETGPVLVDGEGSSVDGGSIRDTCSGSSPAFGRVLFGWGAHLLNQHVSGVWSDQEKLLHINLLEMKALFLGLQAFREVVIGHVTAMCDNSMVVAYVNKQGGTVSRALCLLANRLLRWTESFDMSESSWVAPLWPEKEWFADLLLLLTQPPLPPALVGQSASAAPLQPLPPRRPRAEPSLVATLKRHFRKLGFSGRAARVLSGCLRSSTSHLYQSRWQIFCGWCRCSSQSHCSSSRGHLRYDKGLSVSAVKGYSSALNSVLALKGRDLASSREITMLLRSFSRSVDPVELCPPAWDVALVLQSLTGAPYEPLRT